MDISHIEVYARWKGQTDEERETQRTLWPLGGRIGYLREDHFEGLPYALYSLCREVFQSDKGFARIPAMVLIKRLPAVLLIVERRMRKIYGKGERRLIRKATRSFTDFVRLCKRKEWKTGEPVTIITF